MSVLTWQCTTNETGEHTRSNTDAHGGLVYTLRRARRTTQCELRTMLAVCSAQSASGVPSAAAAAASVSS